MNILFLLILCALKRDMSGMRVNITALLKPTILPVETILISKKHFNNFVEIKVEQVPYTSAFEKNKMFLLYQLWLFSHLPTIGAFLIYLRNVIFKKEH